MMQNKLAQKKEGVYTQPKLEGGYPNLKTMIDLTREYQTQCDIARLNLNDNLTFLVSELEKIALEQKA